jgi:thioesterase domain-containing protein
MTVSTLVSTLEKTVSPALVENNAAPSEQEIFVMPATPCQIRFWLLDSIHPGNHSLNMPLAWKCLGKLDLGVAAAALAELVRRHESLRTTFEMVDGVLSQVIHPPYEVALPVEDLRRLAKEERQRQANAIIQQQARIQMDMKTGPLLFARAIQMGAEENILLLTIHHSVCDGWSNGVVIRDFAAIYDGLVRQTPAKLPELPIQFGDYAVWLDEWRKGKEPAEHLKYWRETLEGNFTTLHIQRDFNGDGDEARGEIKTLLLPAEEVREARDFCVAQGITLYTLLLSVYAVMLHQLTGQEDILIGTPCANRRQETEDLIGPFSNPQVIRVKIEDGQSLGSVVERVRDWTLGAMAHQVLPFEDLNDDEFFSRAENQIALQVYFIYQKAFMQIQRASSLEIVPLRSVSPGTTFDLMLSIVERAEGPRLQLEYNPRHFGALTIQKILQSYLQILKAILSDQGNLAGEATARNSGKDQLPAALLSKSENGALNSFPRNNALVTHAPSEDFVSHPDSLELQLEEIWKTAMGIKSLSPHESFFDLGGRSLAAMRIVSRINKTYSVDFGLATLFSAPTVAQMAELVRKKISVNVSSSVVAMQPHGSAEPLFIIHGAGGNIIRFYQLAMLVKTEHPVYGVQAQSLLVGQPAILRLEDQAAFYLKEIRGIQPKGPYYFLGYSFGSTIALEIAHQLRALGERVELLGMLDSRERDCVVTAQRNDSARVQFDRRMARFWGNLSDLSLAEKSSYLWDKLYTRTLRRIYQLAVKLGFRSVPSFMKSTDDITWVAAMNYRTKPWPETMTLFRTAIQPDPRLPMDLGWTPYAQGGLEILELPGDHDLVFREPNIQALAAQLRSRLKRSDATKNRVSEPAA